MAQSITNPILSLIQETEIIAKGDYDNIRKSKRKDESGKLQNAFFLMAQKIRSSQAILSQKLAELEKFRDITVGREIKMVELKKQIKELQKTKNNKKSK